MDDCVLPSVILIYLVCGLSGILDFKINSLDSDRLCFLKQIYSKIYM